MLLDIQEALQIGKAMIAEGKLQLDVVWDGKQITGVSIRSSRPLAACRILDVAPAEIVPGLEHGGQMEMKAS